jgi:hypothetical protein
MSIRITVKSGTLTQNENIFKRIISISWFVNLYGNIWKMKLNETAGYARIFKENNTVPCKAIGIASFWIFDGDFHFNCSQASHKTSTIPLETEIVQLAHVK